MARGGRPLGHVYDHFPQPLRPVPKPAVRLSAEHGRFRSQEFPQIPEMLVQGVSASAPCGQHSLHASKHSSIFSIILAGRNNSFLINFCFTEK
jgi:hypothetical protein